MENGAEKLTPTPAGAWREAREQGYVQELPSGMVARLRPVDLPTLLVAGHVPDILTPIVNEMMFGKPEDAPEPTSEQTVELVELMNLVVTAAFVEPRIVDNPQADDEIHITDIDYEDRGFVYTLATQPARVLRSFRLQPDGDVEPVPNGHEDGPAPEPPA